MLCRKRGKNRLRQSFLQAEKKLNYSGAVSGHGHGIVMAFTYYPDINEYQGVRTPQIVIQNYK